MGSNGFTHIRVRKSTNNKLLDAREITGLSVSEMVEEAVAAYLDVEVMAKRLETAERRRKILLGQLSTP